MTILSQAGADDGQTLKRPATDAGAQVRAAAWPSAEQLNSLRGLACLLLVAFHVSEASLQQLAASFPTLMAFHEVMEPVRMPLFSFLSGFIYAYRPVAPGTLFDFEAKKVRRLLVPFLSLTLIIFAMRWLAPGDQGAPMALWHYLAYPFSHLWFLQALFFVFLAFAVADSFLPDRRVAVACVIFSLSLPLFVSPFRGIAAFSIGDAAYILPFFSLGVLACRQRGRLEAHSRPVTAALAAIVALFAVYAFRLVLAGGDITKDDPVILLMSLSSIMLLLMVFPRVGWLASIGVFSFSIYLFHTIFTAVAGKLAPDTLWVALSTGFVAAIAGPIAVELVIERYLPVFGFVIGKGFRAGADKPR